MENKELVVFLDSVSRTLAGVKINETKTTVTIENPVIVNAMPNQNGQMSLQLIPVFFREILGEKNQDCAFTYQKDAIVTSNITQLESNVEKQYAMLFSPIPEELDTEEGDADNVIDLFGDGEGGK